MRHDAYTGSRGSRVDQETASEALDPNEWLRQQQERTAALKEQAEQASAELDGSSVTVSSRDQAVSLTVNPGGILLDLRFGASAGDLSLTQLSDRILRTYQNACTQAAALTVEIMSDLVGEDSAALDFLINALPPLDEDDDGDDRYDDSPAHASGAEERTDAGAVGDR